MNNSQRLFKRYMVFLSLLAAAALTLAGNFLKSKREKEYAEKEKETDLKILDTIDLDLPKTSLIRLMEQPFLLIMM